MLQHDSDWLGSNNLKDCSTSTYIKWMTYFAQVSMANPSSRAFVHLYHCSLSEGILEKV